jgi:hypothetical protein
MDQGTYAVQEKCQDILQCVVQPHGVGASIREGDVLENQRVRQKIAYETFLVQFLLD